MVENRRMDGCHRPAIATSAAQSAPRTGLSALPSQSFGGSYLGEQLQADAQWQVNGAPTLAGGVLTLRRAQQDAIATLAATDGAPIASVFEARVSVSDPQSAPQVVPQGSFY
jgi:hypothetical protein